MTQTKKDKRIRLSRQLFQGTALTAILCAFGLSAAAQVGKIDPSKMKPRTDIPSSPVLSDKAKEALKSRPMQIQISSPQEGSALASPGRIKFSAIAKLGTKLTGVQYKVLNPDGVEVDGGVLCQSAQACGSRIDFDRSINLGAVRNGAFKLAVQIQDQSGQIMNASRQFSLMQRAVVSPTPLPVAPAESLMGKVSESPTAEVNQCAKDVPLQFSDDPARGISLSRKSRTHQFEFDVDFPAHNHIQGTARLRDWNGLGRIVTTENVTGDGFQLGFHPAARPDREAIFDTSSSTTNRRSFDIIGTEQAGRYAHPGGAQAQGDYVITGMQDSLDGAPAAFLIMKVDGETISVADFQRLDGSLGEPLQRDRNSQAGSAAMTQLENGKYLVAVYDDAGASIVIWFYRSDTPYIRPDTNWQPVGQFVPSCREFGTASDACMKGGQGGLSFVTDCTGKIYLFGMDGEFTGNIGRRNDKHWFQAWKLAGTPDNISLTKSFQQRAEVGDRPTQTSSFRWSGHTYVDRNGRLHVASSERHTGGSFLGRSNGSAFGIVDHAF